MADPLMAGDFFERTVDTLQCPPAEAVQTDVDYDRYTTLMSTKSLFDAYGKLVFVRKRELNSSSFEKVWEPRQSILRERGA